LKFIAFSEFIAMGISRVLSKVILRLFGWKITGEVSSDLQKYILAVVPHTSNWDFPLGLLVRSAMGLKVKFLGKSSLFRFPFGVFFRLLGGYPVDRSKRQNYVEAVADIFNEKKEFAVCIAPEGTRGAVEKLKSGFYYMAREAGVPIIMVRFDYGKKEVDFSAPITADQTYEEILEVMRAYFGRAKGKIPENAWPHSAPDSGRAA
jgi:1-acyl-sn-glycerol-3-phosphate acyltransferase